MYKFLLRNGTTAAFVIGFLIAIFIVYLAVTGAGDYASDDFNSLYGVSEFGTIVNIGRILTILAVIVIVLGGIYGFLTNPKSSMKFFIGLIILAAMIGIFYSMAKPETSGTMLSLVEEYDIKGTVSKLISGGILATVVLLGIAFVTIVLAEIRNAFN